MTAETGRVGWRTWAMVLTAVGLLAGCSRSEVVAGPGKPRRTEISMSQVEFFAAGGYPTWASTDTHVVGFAGRDTERPDVDPRYGAFDLAEGRVVSLPVPDPDRVVEPWALGGLSDAAVLVAARCGAPPSIDEPHCTPSELALYRIDPGSDEGWEPLDLPANFAGAPLQVGNVGHVQPTDDGVAFILPGQDDSAGLVIEATDSGVQLLDLRAPLGRDHCLTDDSLFALQLGDTSDLSESVDVALLQSSPGEEPRPVETPDVPSGFGGIALRLACDRGSVYLTSSNSPPEEPRPVVWQLDASGATWTKRPDLVPEGASLVLDSLSSHAGIALTWGEGGLGGGSIVTARASETGVMHRDVPGGVMAWRGSQPELLVTPTHDTDNTDGSTTVQKLAI